MFDIHYHLLFGVDDGPKEFEESLALAEASVVDGVTHIVCTPHSNDKYKFQPELNRERMEMVQERFVGRLTLGLGCDFHLSFENIEDLHKNPARYTINGKRYLLVEFPDFGIQPNMSTVLYNMITSGITPIITHPERNPTLISDPTRMVEWLQIGCIVQVTASSLTGRFGSRAQEMSEELLQKNWVHIIASDAHSTERRGPAMTKAYNWLLENHSKEVADRLCMTNPKAIYFGERLPAQPASLDLFEDRQPVKKGFFSRIFGS